MKTRAAVAFKAGEPLSIETVDLQGPRAGAGKEISTRPFHLVTGRVWRGALLIMEE